MVGGKNLALHPEIQSQESAPNLIDRLWEGAKIVHAPAFQPGARFQVYDDHIPFMQQGLPAVDLIDLDYPEWHTSKDVPASCSAASLAQAGRVLLWHLYPLDASSWGPGRAPGPCRRIGYTALGLETIGQGRAANPLAKPTLPP